MQRLRLAFLAEYQNPGAALRAEIDTVPFAIRKSYDNAAIRRSSEIKRIGMVNSKEMLESPLFQSLANMAFDSVMVAQASDDHNNPVIIYVNQAFTDLTGYSAEEVLGETPGLLQGPRTEKAVTDRLAEDLRNNRTFHGSTINYRKDGTPFTIEWKVSPVVAGTDATYYVAVQRSGGEIE